MLIGAMNNPSRNLFEEIAWMSKMGLDFIDLTFEPPMAATWNLDAKKVRAALDDSGLKVIGHTAYYLPICSPFESIRRAAVDELKRALEMFALVGAPWMNLHPDRHAPLHERSFITQTNLKTLRELLPLSRQAGVGLMIENLPGSFNTVAQLGPFLEAIPELGLHLDIGHCNLMTETNTAPDLISTYGARLRHVHLHDNKGGTADLHLPLGTGTLDVLGCLRSLHAAGYDETITLEVFSEDRNYFAYSRDLLRALWEEVTGTRETRRENEHEAIAAAGSRMS
jgi:sugar phosphate isomerase/epimerase